MENIENIENFEKSLDQFAQELKKINGNIGELENWAFRKKPLVDDKLDTYYKFKMYEAITLGLLELDNLDQEQLTFYLDKLLDNQLEERFIYDTYLHKQLLPPMVKYLVNHILDKSTSQEILNQSWNGICENIPRAGTGLVAFLERIVASEEKTEWFLQILSTRVYKNTDYELIIKNCLELAHNEHLKTQDLLHSEELVSLRTLEDVENYIKNSLNVLEQNVQYIPEPQIYETIISNINELKMDLARSGIANILDSPIINKER
ncbi:MAG: hypothetical protein BEN18_02385 [Epulopiscium sp. Nuni2H_MBin001]|nr:MAG: hypothetical protein BEN18_02385 [Epulopiscium sp. Nuni2H_MBin001]